MCYDKEDMETGSQRGTLGPTWEILEEAELCSGWGGYTLICPQIKTEMLEDHLLFQTEPLPLPFTLICTSAGAVNAGDDDDGDDDNSCLV